MQRALETRAALRYNGEKFGPVIVENGAIGDGLYTELGVYA